MAYASGAYLQSPYLNPNHPYSKEVEQIWPDPEMQAQTDKPYRTAVEVGYWVYGRGVHVEVKADFPRDLEQCRRGKTLRLRSWFSSDDARTAEIARFYKDPTNFEKAIKWDVDRNQRLQQEQNDRQRAENEASDKEALAQMAAEAAADSTN